MEVFEKVLANEQNIQTVSREVLFNISSEEKTFFSFNFAFAENKSDDILAGDLSLQISDKTMDMHIFQNCDDMYIGQSEEKYFKTKVHSDIFEFNVYRQGVISLLKENESFVNALQIEIDPKNKTVVFRFPAEFLSRIFDYYVKPIVLSDIGTDKEDKETIVKQVSNKLSKKFDTRVDNGKIENIVREEMEKINTNIQNTLNNIRLIDAEYTITFNEQNFLTKENLIIKAEKDGRLIDIVYKYSAKDFNEDIDLFVPDFDKANIVEVNSISDVLILSEN